MKIIISFYNERPLGGADQSLLRMIEALAIMNRNQEEQNEK